MYFTLGLNTVIMFLWNRKEDWLLYSFIFLFLLEGEIMINVHSEIMPLKRVLLHKPGKKARYQFK